MAPLGLLLGLLAAAPADAAQVKITGVTASGTKANDDNGKYDPKYVNDGKQQVYWVEGGEGSGLGSAAPRRAQAARTPTQPRGRRPKERPQDGSSRSPGRRERRRSA